jgi:hypothetical protein
MYDPLTLEAEDTNVKRMVQETMEQFKVDDSAEKPTIVIKTSMVIQ